MPPTRGISCLSLVLHGIRILTSEFKSIGSEINIFTAGSKLLLTNNILRLCNDEQFSSIYISFTIFARSCQIASAVLCIDEV